MAAAAGIAAFSICRSLHAQETRLGSQRPTGMFVPELAALDDFMLKFIQEQRVPGAALAVTRHRRLVYARGFGLADKDGPQPIEPSSRFRIASISKSITAVAVLQLAERGMLALDESAWRALALSEPSDARWKNVSILNLLQHTGGWDSDKTFDPLFAGRRIARELGIDLPIHVSDVIRYMLGLPLQYDPGRLFAYSNFGYCLLGRLIEHVSGLSYERYVQERVLQPLGISDMRLAKSLWSERTPKEVVHYDEQQRRGPAIVGTIGEQVSLPYGTWSMDLVDSAGGWLGSAAEIARFGSAFDDPEMCPILRPESIATMFRRPQREPGKEVSGNYPGCGWFVWPEDRFGHRAFTTSNGLLPGASSYLMRRHDGVNWVALFNTGRAPDGHPLMTRFRDLSPDGFDAVTRWPEVDQFETLPAAFLDHGPSG